MVLASRLVQLRLPLDDGGPSFHELKALQAAKVRELGPSLLCQITDAFLDSDLSALNDASLTLSALDWHWFDFSVECFKAVLGLRRLHGLEAIFSDTLEKWPMRAKLEL